MSSTITNLLKTLRIIPTNETNVNVQQQQITANQKCSANNKKCKSLPEICLQTVALHDDFRDCWIVIYDRVYNVTDFLNEHPGGADVIMDYAGRDATLAFHDTGHSSDAIKQMKNYLIGELPSNERIFRTNGRQVISKGIPE